MMFLAEVVAYLAMMTILLWLLTTKLSGPARRAWP